MIILIDADGVLLDWEPAFHRFMLRYGYVGDQCDLTKYRMNLRYGIDRTTSNLYVRHFNESCFMSSISPLRDSVKYVRKLHDDHGYKFHVITSQSDLYQAQQLRIQNLTNTFGDVFEGFTILNTGADKSKSLKKFKGTGYYWIEDKLENAIAGQAIAGLNPILVRHEHTDMESCNNALIPAFWSWKEIYNHITGE
tara:strand:+ start:536 stop:1120 length:585 start_codon:yes stop_codon:yes gene_type:complete